MAGPRGHEKGCGCERCIAYRAREKAYSATRVRKPDTRNTGDKGPMLVTLNFDEWRKARGYDPVMRVYEVSV